MPRAPLLVVGLAAGVLVAVAALGDGSDGAAALVDGPRGPARDAFVVVVSAPLPKPHPIVCPLAPDSTSFLPASARRGLAHHLRQYPAVALATTGQRRAAARLLGRLRVAARGWRDARAASRDGFATAQAARRAGDATVHYLHAEHRRFSADRRFLDPRRPESLIYANAPGRPLVLVGLMFSMRRGLPGSTPGGPLTRWHSHLVCVRGDKRGLNPRADGSCPRGSKRRQGSEMMHVWFTGDLRSAFAIHAPERELCEAGLLPAATCLHPGATRVM